MSDDTIPETAVSHSEPTGESQSPAAADSGAATPATPNGSGPRPDGAPRRRRRGSRGGRNRKRPATASGAAGAPATDDEPDDDFDAEGDLAASDDGLDERRQPQSYFDAGADRGLTGDDIAEAAKEDAGLAGTTATGAPRVGDAPPASPSATPSSPSAAPPAAAPAARPRIGDSRPAPDAASAAGAAGVTNGDGETAAPKRRRRRGGRGHGRGAGTGAAGTNGNGESSTAANGTPARDRRAATTSCAPISALVTSPRSSSTTKRGSAGAAAPVRGVLRVAT